MMRWTHQRRSKCMHSCARRTSDGSQRLPRTISRCSWIRLRHCLAPWPSMDSQGTLVTDKTPWTVIRLTNSCSLTMEMGSRGTHDWVRAVLCLTQKTLTLIEIQAKMWCHRSMSNQGKAVVQASTFVNCSRHMTIDSYSVLGCSTWTLEWSLWPLSHSLTCTELSMPWNLLKHKDSLQLWLYRGPPRYSTA